MPEPVRLVIWDLDETFWKGTLTEGGIKYLDSNHAVVIELAHRGIMSAICSKNDIERVKKILIERGIWDYFIFPSIDWTSKGARIQGIIDAVQLRPDSVLFLDDNALNRNEALNAVSGLRVADETVIGSLLDDPLLQGKSDRELNRLKDYKLLEEKSENRKTFGKDNTAFLRESAITVEIVYEITDHLDRAVELINRTNQLNFTKRRLSGDLEEARQALISELNGEFTRRAGLVRVRDRFGDYGIVGFWAIEGHAARRSRALHFCFSCRTLGMGVEQWVYDKLGRPEIDVVGEVVSALDFVPDWINGESSSSADAQKNLISEANVLLRGGCEMEVLEHFFSFHARAVTSELLYFSGVLPYWMSHIAVLEGRNGTDQAVYEAALEGLGYEASAFDSALHTDGGGSDLIVLSFSANALVSTYRNKQHGFLFASMLWGLHWCLASETDENLERFATERGLDAGQRQLLSKHVTGLRSDFDWIVPTDHDYRKMYESLFERLSPSKLIVMVLPLEEVPQQDGSSQKIEGNVRMNQITRDVVAGRDNVVCIETGAFVGRYEDLLEGSFQHYSREINYQLYKKIAETYENWKTMPFIKNTNEHRYSSGAQ